MPIIPEFGPSVLWYVARQSDGQMEKDDRKKNAVGYSANYYVLYGKINEARNPCSEIMQLDWTMQKRAISLSTSG